MNSTTQGKSIVFIGAGGLSWSLASALFGAGMRVIQVVSPSVTNGQALAHRLGASHTASFEELAPADFYFMALPDRVIESVANSISFPSGAIVIHSSGSIPLSSLATHFPNAGVLYPLQTFTRGRVISLENVPIFVEAASSEALAIITALADTISSEVIPINSEQRRNLHLAGVIANNFTNFLLGLSDEWMEKNGFSLHLLQPLMAETVKKAFEVSPLLSQTGPARRLDIPVVDRHMKMLANTPELQKLYGVFSDLIIQKTKEQTNNDKKNE